MRTGVNVLAGVHVHVHPDIVPGGVDLAAEEADVLGGGVTDLLH